MENNSHAGQGSVVLDIGGTVGALVVMMPSEYVGVEIELAPVGERTHSHSPADGHHHHHPQGQAHSHDHGHLVHVGVVNRPIDGRSGPLVATAVFGEVEEGSYEVYERPDGPTGLIATVRGGAVTELAWPAELAVSGTMDR